ncbi:MAG: hypothetical protein ACXW2A_12570 [Burkholderiales bacterium]
MNTLLQRSLLVLALSGGPAALASAPDTPQTAAEVAIGGTTVADRQLKLFWHEQAKRAYGAAIFPVSSVAALPPGEGAARSAGPNELLVRGMR